MAGWLLFFWCRKDGHLFQDIVIVIRVGSQFRLCSFANPQCLHCIHLVTGVGGLQSRRRNHQADEKDEKEAGTRHGDQTGGSTRCCGKEAR